MIQVGDTIYLLMLDGDYYEIEGILSHAYKVESIDDTSGNVTVIEKFGFKKQVPLHLIEEQVLLCDDQSFPSCYVTEGYMWTTDIKSGMKKMIEESIENCNRWAHQFLDMGERLFDMYKNNLYTMLDKQDEEEPDV